MGFTSINEVTRLSILTILANQLHIVMHGFL